MLKQYPSALPAPLKADRAFQMVDPLVSSSSDNGQTRWDRRFSDVPTSTPVSWIFTDVQCQVFEAWYRDTIRDGAEWFEFPIRSPMGLEAEQCHFIKGYSGPSRLGFDFWKIEANLLLRRRPMLPPEWGLMPDFLLNPGFFDISINRVWPENRDEL